MKAWIYAVSSVVALAASVVVAVQVASFLEMDACVDAGGRYIASTGACDIEENEYVALFSRPRLYGLWTLVLGGCFIAGSIVFKIVALVLTRLSAAQERRAVDVAKPRA